MPGLDGRWVQRPYCLLFVGLLFLLFSRPELPI